MGDAPDPGGRTGTRGYGAAATGAVLCMCFCGTASGAMGASDMVAITTITLIWICIWVKMVSGGVFTLLFLLLMLFSCFLCI